MDVDAQQVDFVMNSSFLVDLLVVNSCDDNEAVNIDDNIANGSCSRVANKESNMCEFDVEYEGIFALSVDLLGFVNDKFG